MRYELREIRPESTHRGWKVYHLADNPVTGTWVAERYGVELCAGSRAGLIASINSHEEDKKLWRERYADELPERDFYEGDSPDY